MIGFKIRIKTKVKVIIRIRMKRLMIRNKTLYFNRQMKGLKFPIQILKEGE